MKRISGFLLLAVFVVLGASQQSCKPKKVLVNPSAEVKRETPVQQETAPAVKEEPKEERTAAVTPVTETAPNYNFRNIQFELDSYVLKTESYAILDQIYREMKKDPNARFFVYGHASIEGTAAYNQKLSLDRANAVKIYLVNSGVNPNNLTTVGKGANEPIASNDTESGRTLNRRVEIKLAR